MIHRVCISAAKRVSASSAIALLAVLCLAGCSNDRHVFYSTPDQPTTVSIADPLTNSVLWEMEIPVQRKLVVNFERKGDVEIMKVDPKKPATKVKWKLYDLQSNDKFEEHEQPLPGTPIVMRVRIRPPELTPGQTETMEGGSR